MIPKLIRGASFKGAAAYLLHDKNAETSNRVAWTHTRNLASERPDIAWRVMAATALDADRLKAQAGIKNTGRKSNQAVLHLVLSWHPNEAAALDRDQMLAASESALVALGAGERQALIIAHNDSPHPHVHLLVNRVSSEDGRMLPSSKEKLKLSRWAEAYEKSRGPIFCEERVLNNEARARGDYTRAEPDTPRQIIEAEKELRFAANDNRSRIARLREQQREEIRALGARMRETLQQHQRDWLRFEAEHQSRLAAVRLETMRRRAKAREQIIAEFRPEWRALRQREREAIQQFDAREATVIGRLRNVMAALKIGRSAIDGDRARVMTNSFASVFTRENRREALETQFSTERDALLQRQRYAVRRTATALLRERRFAITAISETYQADRAALIDAHARDEAHLKAAWRGLADARRRAYDDLRGSLGRRAEFRRAASAESLYDRLKRRALARGFGEATREQSNERER